MPVTEPEKAGTSSRGRDRDRIAHRGIDDSGNLRNLPKLLKLWYFNPGFHVHTYIHIHKFTYICIHVHTYIHTYMYAYMYMYAYIHVCIHVCTCMVELTIN